MAESPRVRPHELLVVHVETLLDLMRLEHRTRPLTTETANAAAQVREAIKDAKLEAVSFEAGRAILDRAQATIERQAERIAILEEKLRAEVSTSVGLANECEELRRPQLGLPSKGLARPPIGGGLGDHEQRGVEVISRILSRELGGVVECWDAVDPLKRGNPAACKPCRGTGEDQDTGSSRCKACGGSGVAYLKDRVAT